MNEREKNNIGAVGCCTAALVFLLGCMDMPGIRSSGEPADSAGPRADGPAISPSVMCDSIADHGLRVDASTRTELEAAVGPPDSLTVHTEPNRHVRSAVDSMIVFHYATLDAEYRKPGPGSGDLLERVTVRDNQHLRYPLIGLGATTEQVRHALGAPARESNSVLEYMCSKHEVGPQPLRFHVQNDVVRSIEFNYYVD